MHEVSLYPPFALKGLCDISDSIKNARIGIGDYLGLSTVNASIHHECVIATFSRVIRVIEIRLASLSQEIQVILDDVCMCNDIRGKRECALWRTRVRHIFQSLVLPFPIVSIKLQLIGISKSAIVLWLYVINQLKPSIVSNDEISHLEVYRTAKLKG